MIRIGYSMRLVAGAAVAIGLSACDAPPQPTFEKVGMRLPASICDGANGSVAPLIQRAVLVVDGPGTATIEQAVWLSLGEGGREQLVNALALKAACAAKEPPAEQVMTVRSNEGMVLMRRTVDLSGNLGG